MMHADVDASPSAVSRARPAGGRVDRGSSGRERRRLARIILLLRDIEEKDTAETAQILGISENAVKTRLHRARQALRTLLDARFGRTTG